MYFSLTVRLGFGCRPSSRTLVDAEDNAVIEIYRDGERFSGRIVSLKEPNYPDGHSQAGQRDSNNPDESKQDRRIVGLNMIEGFEHIGDGRYEGGTI